MVRKAVGRPAVVVSAVLLVVIALPFAIWSTVGSHDAAAGAGSAPPASIGVVQDRSVPTAIDNLPLEDQAGHGVTLGQFRGRIVFLVPFLTSCQEECPVTTGALLEMWRAITRDGIAHHVVIIQATVDPGRDTPARLAAYARFTGSDWPLLTGTTANLARLWHYFGVYYQQVPESSPPGIDWETYQPYTYDVNHSDGFILLDAQLHERFFAGGMAKVAGVTPRLRGLLDNQGEDNLHHPGGGSWTVPDALAAIKWALRPSVTGS